MSVTQRDSNQNSRVQYSPMLSCFRTLSTHGINDNIVQSGQADRGWLEALHRHIVADKIRFSMYTIPTPMRGTVVMSQRGYSSSVVYKAQMH